MDLVTAINTAVGLMALVLGGFAIWLALYLYSKSKETETKVATSLEAIRAQSEALQKLTGRWMDRFTRHAVEPRPADEGLMQLVHVVASLPTTILAQVQGNNSATQSQHVLLQEVVDSYIGLYYYTALSNVVAQGQLPDESVFDAQNSLHTGLQALVDRTASDFTHMANVLQRVDQSRLNASPLSGLLNEAISQWQPYVRYASQVFEARRTEPGI